MGLGIVTQGKFGRGTEVLVRSGGLWFGAEWFCELRFGAVRMLRNGVERYVLVGRGEVW